MITFGTDTIENNNNVLAPNASVNECFDYDVEQCLLFTFDFPGKKTGNSRELKTYFEVFEIHR